MKYVALMFCALALTIAAITSGENLPTTKPTTIPHLSATIPTTAGHTRMRFYTTIAGKPLDMCVVFSNSKKIAQTKGKVPAMLFLGGLGERGSNGDHVFYNGPAPEMVRHAYLNDSLPMLIISPQPPEEWRWEDPAMADAVVQLADILVADPRIDPDRFYLSGFSSGGKGCFLVATRAAKYFAAIAPVAADEYSPKECAAAIKDIPTWMIVGDQDGKFIAGSRLMATALKAAGGIYTLSELPGVGHNAWITTYPKPEFYEWFMAHTRGKPPSTQYSDDQLNTIARAPVIDPVIAAANKDFATFAPFWHMLNCSTDGFPGLRPEFNGRKNVFVVRPLDAKINCVFETTWKIPADKRTSLTLQVGRDEATDWKMIVRIAGRDEMTIAIDKATAPGGWYETSIDLTQWAGKDLQINISAAPGASGIAPAYFGKIAIESR